MRFSAINWPMHNPTLTCNEWFVVFYDSCLSGEDPGMVHLVHVHPNPVGMS